MASLIVDADEDILTKIHTAEVTCLDVQDVIGRELSKEEKALLADFESSWKTFVRSKRGRLPSGRRETNLQYMQNKVKELTETRNNVEEELNKQLAFFHDSTEKLEKDLRARTEYEKQEYETSEQQLKEELEDVLGAKKLQKETLPWNFFLSTLDSEADSNLSEADLETSRTIKPSKRAMYLTYQSSLVESEGMLRRAFQIDNAILRTRLTMLNKQIQRYEKTIASQERASHFLMENNVWSILQ